MGWHRLLLLSLLWRLTAGQALDCSAALKPLETSLSSLQPCVNSSGGVSLVLDGSRRFVSPSGSPRQTLNLGFQQSVLLLPPGAEAEISTAYLRGVRLQAPATLSMRLLVGIVVQPTATLHLRDVLLETDCATLLQYLEWYSSSQPAQISVNGDGDLIVSSWQLGGTSLTSCNITCARPSYVITASLSGDGTPTNTTTVSVSSELDLYNALALTVSYQPGPINLALQKDISFSSQLWIAQPISLYRSVTIVGNQRLGAPDGLITRPILDLQDVVSGVSLANSSVVVSARNLTFANGGMVFGYAPVPFTGLGLVPPFLWFFDFKRLLLPSRPPSQLQVTDCDIIVYPEDLDHMALWGFFLSSTVESIAKAMEPFKIGVYSIKLENSTKGSKFEYLDAYAMEFTATTLISNVVANYTLTARRSEQPLYKLIIPPSTSAIAIWTQADLQNALANAQRLTACSPFSNVTVYLHLFNNISLDGSKWPTEGFGVSCNVTISGSLNRAGGTWLNFNLLSKFIKLSNGAVLTLRSLTLLNMPSLKRTYDLTDLTQMTLPLWPLARPMGGASYLVLQDCTVVLPYEEYLSVATMLGAATGGYPSQALNASLRTAKVASSSLHRISLSSFGGLNMTAIDLELVDATVHLPYSALLGSNTYGTLELMSRYRPNGDGNTSSDGSDSGGLSTAAVIAIAVAVPLGVVVTALVFVLVLRGRRRRRHRSVSDGGRGADGGSGGGHQMLAVYGGPSGVAARAGSQSEKRLAEPSATPGGSGGNSPLSDQSGEMDGKVDPSNQLGGVRSEREDDSVVKASECDSDATPAAPPLHVELHQLILDFAREIEDKHLTIHDALGSGGFATVYRGTWRGIDVAVKVIEFQDRTAGNEHLQARAMTEAAIAANIQHANIVTTYSYDIRPVQGNEPAHDTPSSSTLLGIGPAPEGGPPVLARRRSGSSDQSSASQAPRMWKLYLIQEFCEVGSLRVALENRMLQTADGQPNLMMILRVALDIVRGLQHLHKKNIVHGDLTPGNILLKANLSRPGHYTAKLADFGLSVKMNPAQTSVDNNRIGTPFYASPEVRSHGNLTKASDLYALGVVLWEMWHGRPCYQRVRGVKHYIHATGYPSFPPACPPLYADIATRCLRRALEERPQLGEVHDALRQLLGGISSGSTACSEAGTSGATSYEWPFVLQVANENALAAAYGGCFDAGGGAGGRAGGGGGGGGSGSNTSSTRSVAGPAAGNGPGGVAVMAGQLLAGCPYTARAHPLQRASSRQENPGGAGAVAAAPVAALAAGFAWGTGPGAAQGGVPAGDGTWPRCPPGPSRMNQEAGCQHSLPQQQQEQQPRQSLLPDRALHVMQHMQLPPPEALAVAESYTPSAVPPQVQLSPPAPLPPPPVPQPAAAALRPDAVQPPPPPVGAAGAGHASCLSISLNLPTAEDFVTAPGSTD